MTITETPRRNHPALGTAPTLHVSKLRLVFGPADSVSELLVALAAALDGIDLTPRAFDCSRTPEGYRLRVTCELDPERTDLRRVLGRLLRRRRCDSAAAGCV